MEDRENIALNANRIVTRSRTAKPAETSVCDRNETEDSKNGSTHNGATAMLTRDEEESFFSGSNVKIPKIPAKRTDDLWDYDAPQFHDFGEHETLAIYRDDWFAKHPESPAAKIVHRNSSRDTDDDAAVDALPLDAMKINSDDADDAAEPLLSYVPFTATSANTGAKENDNYNGAMDVFMTPNKNLSQRTARNDLPKNVTPLKERYDDAHKVLERRLAKEAAETAAQVAKPKLSPTQTKRVNTNNNHIGHYAVPAPAPFMVRRSVKPLTIPKEFNFATTSRPKKPTESVLEEAKKPISNPSRKPISANARSASTSSSMFASRKPTTTTTTTKSSMAANKSATRPTVAERLHDARQRLAESQRIKERLTNLRQNMAAKKAARETHSPYVPLAVRVKQFETKTPDRFKKESKIVPAPVHKPTQLTRPSGPSFLDRGRVHTKKVLSSEEIELEKIRAHQFKAKPVDSKVFKAAPVLHRTLSRPKLTVPHSPAITKPRPRSTSRDQKSEESHIIKANPCRIPPTPHLKLPHRKIMPGDFKLPGERMRERNRIKIEEENARLEAEKEKERNFKANPVPESTLHYHPLPKKRPEHEITVPESPHLLTKARAPVRKDFDDVIARKEMEAERQEAEKEAQRKIDEKEEIKELRRTLVTRAHPAPLHEEPFVTRASTRELTVPKTPLVVKRNR